MMTFLSMVLIVFVFIVSLMVMMNILARMEERGVHPIVVIFIGSILVVGIVMEIKALSSFLK